MGSYTKECKNKAESIFRQDREPISFRISQFNREIETLVLSWGLMFLVKPKNTLKLCKICTNRKKLVKFNKSEITKTSQYLLAVIKIFQK